MMEDITNTDTLIYSQQNHVHFDLLTDDIRFVCSLNRNDTEAETDRKAQLKRRVLKSNIMLCS